MTPQVKARQRIDPGLGQARWIIHELKQIKRVACGAAVRASRACMTLAAYALPCRRQAVRGRQACKTQGAA